jgi:O-acetyl-ADP-ribose deacetylase (regulator of RNase III)
MEPLKPIQYLLGDATRPTVEGNKIIAHVCNNIGAWGAGFVLAVSKRWPEPEETFRTEIPLGLGTVQLVPVAAQMWVANMVAQQGIRSQSGTPPIRYEALTQCLAIVAHHAKERNASVHMPRIGCGLAGGKWELVEPIICETLRDLSVFVYDLPR